MKILLTGGGTGGHFYPLIAVAEKINKIADDKKIPDLKLYFMSDHPYDRNALFDQRIEFISITSGKMRVYSGLKFAIANFFDLFKIFFGCIEALIKLFFLYPDVVFSKGAYASFPIVFSARILGIPIIIHESDSVPGRVNLWAGHFAKKVAISYPEAISFFKKERTAYTGQPIRQDIEHPSAKNDALDYFKFNANMPVLFVIGGSQGAEPINDVVLDALPELIKKYQIIHQVGVKNLFLVNSHASVLVDENTLQKRYRTFPFLGPLEMKMASGAADLVISRASSGIFEIASWGKPSIIIPIRNTNGDHQRNNAYSYDRAGACEVIEENNLTPNLLILTISNIFNDVGRIDAMSKSALAFAKPDASAKIAREILDIALSHEQ